VKNDKKG